MSFYSIKDLERISGVKAHTLRIWEQRYHLFTPERSDTNIRKYSNDELRRLLNVTILYNEGIKISAIAAMDEAGLNAMVDTVSRNSNSLPAQMENLILAMVEMNEAKFEGIISNEILHHGMDGVFNTLLFPFLERVGVMWQTGAINPAQEHFISNLIRQKLIVAINSRTASTAPNAAKCILFLPERELHELSLLYCHYLLKSKGVKTFYLGQALALEDLIKVQEVHQANYFVCITTTNIGVNELQANLNKLSAAFPKATILLSGSQLFVHHLELHPNMKRFEKPAELLDLIK